MIRKWTTLLRNSCLIKRRSEKSTIARFSARPHHRNSPSRSPTFRAPSTALLAKINNKTKQKSQIRSLKMTVVTPPMAIANHSRMRMRHWNTLDSQLLSAQSKASLRSTMKNERRTPSKYALWMQSKKLRKRRHVKKKKRKIRKTNWSVTRSRGKKTIEKKDCWVNYKALAAIQKKLRLSLDSFNKLHLTNSRMLRIKNRLMKNYNKLRRKKRGIKRRRPNK